MRHLILATSTSLLLAASATAQSLTTAPNFADNNGGGTNGALYFDLTGGPTGISVTALDLNISDAAGTAGGINVYVRGGSFAGFEQSSAGWNLVTADAGGVVSAGRGVPTNIPLASPFCVPAGATLGVAVEGVGFGHAYTNGTGANQVVSNADLTISCGSASNPVFGGTLFQPRVANMTVYYSQSAGCQVQLPPGIEGVVETVPLSGTLGTTGGSFTDLSFLRWNITDPGGTHNGKPAAVIVNFGIGGAPPVGTTAAIPGLISVWGGSTPTGIADVLPPNIVGGPDFFTVVPAGLFSLGDQIRLEPIVLDASVGSATRLPVIVGSNTISFRYTNCSAAEGFEGVTGIGNYPTGWANGAGTIEWRGNTGGTSSTATGPTSAIEGTTYFYCETSSPAVVGDVFSLVSATYNDPSVTNLGFQLSRIGVEIGQLEVFFNDGTNPPVLLNTYTGPDPAQSQGGVEWSSEVLALPQPLPASYSFEFRYTTLPLAGGGATFNGDLAIDDICLN